MNNSSRFTDLLIFITFSWSLESPLGQRVPRDERVVSNAFLLVLYGFCSNVLYSASVSFAMFSFPSPDTWDCYYFKSNLCLMLLTKLLLTKKSCNTVLQNNFPFWGYFCHEFIFVFMLYFIVKILSEKY